MRHLRYMRAGGLGVLCTLAIALAACKPEIVDAVELGICARTDPPSTCPSWRDPITIPKTSTNVGTLAGAWTRAGERLSRDGPRTWIEKLRTPSTRVLNWCVRNGRPSMGYGDYAFVPMGSPAPTMWDGKILAPFAVQSALRALANRRRRPLIPSSTTARSMSRKSGKVGTSCSASARWDYETTVSLNHQQVGQHKGGYDSFSFDVTTLLDPSGPQDSSSR